MFLSHFNYEQRKQFLGLAIEILGIDGSIDAQEESSLRALCGEMSLSRNDGIQNPKENIASVFQTEPERRILLCELIGLAYANYEFDPTELQYIEQIAQAVDMDKHMVEQLYELVRQYGELEQKIASVVL